MNFIDNLISIKYPTETEKKAIELSKYLSVPLENLII
jgi:hypothetical protein